MDKAYDDDDVPVSKLFKVLDESETDSTYVTAIKTYQNVVGKIEIGNNVSQTFKIYKGLKYRCLLSSLYLIKIYIQSALRN